MRNAEVIRQWKILKTIEAGRWTNVATLAREHGVTERTIRRDLEALQEAGFPLYDERRDGKKVWRLIEGYQQRLTQSFTLSELAALFFSRNMLSFLGGAPFAQDLESAFAKISEALPRRSLPYLERIQELFSTRPDPWKDYSRKQDVIAGLIDAILHQRQAQTRAGYIALVFVVGYAVKFIEDMWERLFWDATACVGYSNMHPFFFYNMAASHAMDIFIRFR